MNVNIQPRINPEGRALSPETAAALESMRAMAESGNAEWLTLPPHAYVSDEIFEMEKHKIFYAGWVCIGRVEQVANKGDYASVDFLDERLVMTRDKDEKLRVLSRVCRHRWASVCEGSGNASTLVCPYHAWAYHLDGRLRGAPAMAETPSFNKNERGLTEIRHEVWEGFVYVNIDGGAAPLAETLRPLTEAVKQYRLSEWRLVRSRDYGECPWDWKVFQDNGECYHHLGAHTNTFEKIFPALRAWDSPNNGEYTLIWAEAKNGTLVADSHGQSIPSPMFSLDRTVNGLTKEQQENLCLIYVFPNYFISPNPDITLYVRSYPVAAGKLRMFLDYLVPPGWEDGPELEAKLDKLEEFVDEFNDEDTLVCIDAQRGLRSSNATVAPLSRLEGHNRDFALWVARKLTQ